MLHSDRTVLEIIENDRLRTVFQPLVSLKRKSVFALEALTRGADPRTGEAISPSVLFALATEPGTRLALDRACREKALEHFARMQWADRSLMLSLNMDVSCLGLVAPNGSRSLLKAVRRHGVNPSSVIIEITESEAPDTEVLLEFVEFYRKRGFLIALDDVGAGHSNLDRIPLLKPDVLKMDRSLISGVHEQFHKLEVVKSFSQMAGRVGALVVAEGVEREAEALCLLENGVEVLQGFLFARPGPPDADLSGVPGIVESLAATYKERMTRRINEGKYRLSQYDALMLTLGMEIAASGKEVDLELARFVDAYTSIECLYVLDMRGVQVSGTVCNPNKLKRSKRLLYEPADMGTDHSLKEYYLPLRAGLEKFTTPPYISLASGNRCITIAHVFHHRALGRDLILCADIGDEPEDA
ncbi:EAL domain-containing protein [Salidesulfovibrio onnuriiensis]|uniref:EAL domain-containing protein n=1 Tax=Salidesulfovibrio onnuriiensis TaxID=2583823 RepID=UPI0011CC8165|nr:EAL domain-containing protein [Salidesulfovibrio onnuriiensis]